MCILNFWNPVIKQIVLIGGVGGVKKRFCIFNKHLVMLKLLFSVFSGSQFEEQGHILNITSEYTTKKPMEKF